MHESIEEQVGQSLFNFQAALTESGSSLGKFIPFGPRRGAHPVDPIQGAHLYDYPLDDLLQVARSSQS